MSCGDRSSIIVNYQKCFLFIYVLFFLLEQHNKVVTGETDKKWSVEQIDLEISFVYFLFSHLFFANEVVAGFCKMSYYCIHCLIALVIALLLPNAQFVPPDSKVLLHDVRMAVANQG